MAYKTRYILRFDSEKYNHDYRILIKEKDYTGEAEDKALGAAPVLRRDDSDSGISGTSLELVIQADIDSELTSLYTVDNKKFLVELYRNDVLVWCGYVLPEKYSEPYISVPYDVSVTASDGLGILKDIPFALTGERTLFDVIKYCCDQTSLPLDFEIISSLRETSMSESNVMHVQSILESSIFSGKTCYEVLESCMTSLDSFVTQHENKWFVVKYTDLDKKSLIYSNAGTKKGERLLDVGTLGAIGDNFYPVGNLEKDILPAYKSTKLSYDYGKKSSFLSNYDFSSELNNWEYTTLQSPTRVKHFTHDGMGFVRILGRSANGGTAEEPNYIRQTIDVEKTNSSSTFIISHAMGKGFAEGNGEFNVHIKLACGSKTHYLTKSGWRTTSEDIVVSSAYQSQHLGDGDMSWVDSYTEFKILANGFPDSGKLTIQISNPVVTTQYRLYINKVVVTNDVTTGIDVDVNLNTNASTSYASMDIAFGDTPIVANAKKLFNGILWGNGGFTRTWTNGNKTDSYLYTILKCVCSRIGFPRQQLSGIIQGENLQTFMLTRDKYSNLLFHVKEASLNLLTDEMDCTLEQFMPYSELSGETSESARATGNSSEYRSSGDNEVRVYQSGSGVPMRIKDLSPTELQPDSVIEVDRNNAPKSGKATLQKLLEFVLTTGDVWTKEELQVVEGYILYLGEKIKAGDSDLWAGHHFADYLNQPVRTTDPVKFKSVIADYLMSIDFASGLTGFKVGVETEVDILKVRKFFAAAEYLLNQISLVGDEVILTEGGQIDSVEALEGGYYKCILREESVRTGELKVHDICVTDFKLETGFRVIKFEITEVGDGEITVYPEDPVYPPQPMMTFKRIGNFTDTTRQNSIRLSSRDQIIEMQSGVDTYSPTWRNREVLIGKIGDMLPPSLNIPERIRQKASIYAANMIASGNFYQVSLDGVSQQRVPCYKGLWSIEKAPFFYYDQVTDGHVRYTCVYEGEKGTTEEPRFDSDVWQVADGDTALNMKMYNSTGSWDFWDRLDILFDASVEVFAGSKPINNLVNEWEWWLDTGDAGFDAAWKADYGSKTDTQHVDGSTLPTNMQTGSPVLLWCRARIYYKGKTSTNEGYLNLN